MKYYKLTFLDMAFKRHTVSFNTISEYSEFREMVYRLGYEIIK